MLAAGHMDGNITIPGHTVGAAECPSDLLEQEPELPKLYIMVSRKDLYPEVPGTVMRQWATHGVFGEEFNKFLNQLHEEYGPLLEQKDSPTETKTGAGPTGEGEMASQERLKSHRARRGSQALHHRLPREPRSIGPK